MFFILTSDPRSSLPTALQPQSLAPNTQPLAPETCPSPVQFDHVFILEQIIAVDHLALEFPVPPDARILELGEKIMVDMCRQVEHAGSAL